MAWFAAKLLHATVHAGPLEQAGRLPTFWNVGGSLFCSDYAQDATNKLRKSQAVHWSQGEARII
jgi:hypothetical protein